MKEERNQLSVVHFIDVFENHYVIEEDLILKDLHENQDIYDMLQELIDKL